MILVEHVALFIPHAVSYKLLTQCDLKILTNYLCKLNLCKCVELLNVVPLCVFLEQQKVTKVISKFDSPVAFTAGLSASFNGGGNNAVVPYDTVYLNHGDGYRLVCIDY